MAEQPTDYGTLDTEGQNRSAADNIHEITEASKEMFAAGHQLTENLSEREACNRPQISNLEPALVNSHHFSHSRRHSLAHFHQIAGI